LWLALVDALVAVTLAVFLRFQEAAWAAQYTAGGLDISTTGGVLTACWAIAGFLAIVAAFLMSKFARAAGLLAFVAIIVGLVGIASTGGPVAVLTHYDVGVSRTPTRVTLPVLLGMWLVAALPLAASGVLAFRRRRYRRPTQSLGT
jgi:hypothetical protein